jgi:hypothetical protein
MILTRKQYDKMIENKDAVSEYQKTKRSWFLGGVRISGTKEQETKIWAAVRE